MVHTDSSLVSPSGFADATRSAVILPRPDHVTASYNTSSQPHRSAADRPRPRSSAVPRHPPRAALRATHLPRGSRRGQVTPGALVARTGRRQSSAASRLESQIDRPRRCPRPYLPSPLPETGGCLFDRRGARGQGPGRCRSVQLPWRTWPASAPQSAPWGALRRARRPVTRSPRARPAALGAGQSAG